ncbi:MAG: hypothetical protein AAF683_03820 [Pseudomonadota bacterium]
MSKARHNHQLQNEQGGPHFVVPFCIGCIGALLIIGSVHGQEHEHLLPYISFLHGAERLAYRRDLANAFGTLVPWGEPAAISTGHKEELVATRKHPFSCSIVAAKADYSLWSYQHDHSEARLTERRVRGYPEDIADVPITVKTQETSLDLCERIAAAWRVAVRGTRYPNQFESNRVVVDGTMYYFSVLVDRMGEIGGRAYDPEAGTMPAKMVEVARAMKTFANEGGEANLAELEARLLALEQSLGIGAAANAMEPSE